MAGIMVDLTKVREGNPGVSLQEVLKNTGVTDENTQNGVKTFWGTLFSGASLDSAVEAALGAAGLEGGNWLYARWLFFDTYTGVNIDAEQTEGPIKRAKRRGQEIVKKVEEKIPADKPKE